MAVAEVCTFHVERREDPSGGELPGRLTADSLYDLREQCVSRVAIKEFLAWLKVEFFLPRYQLRNVIVCDEVLGVTPASQTE